MKQLRQICTRSTLLYSLSPLALFLACDTDGLVDEPREEQHGTEEGGLPPDALGEESDAEFSEVGLDLTNQLEQPGASILRIDPDVVPAENKLRGGARFGTMCQETYEGSWKDTIDYTWTNCSRFNDRLDNTDSKIYYHNLHGADWNFKDSGDQTNLENVNLFFIETHGGAWSDTATFTMWDNEERGFSKDMYLGNEGQGLSIFSSYSCETLKYSSLWTRWNRPLKGGLRIITGSHDLFFAGYYSRNIGKEYAKGLQASDKIYQAWRDAAADSYSIDNDPAVVTGGTSSSECWSRMNGMKWQNYTSYSRRRDGNMSKMCHRAWSNL
ncbi:MAG: DUF6345 domain-containing protein [Dehalococcoidales bacterium]